MDSDSTLPPESDPAQEGERPPYVVRAKAHPSGKGGWYYLEPAGRWANPRWGRFPNAKQFATKREAEWAVQHLEADLTERRGSIEICEYRVASIETHSTFLAGQGADPLTDQANLALFGSAVLARKAEEHATFADAFEWEVLEPSGRDFEPMGLDRGIGLN